jgi:hypothetical protein
VAKCRFYGVITKFFRGESKFKNNLTAQKWFLYSVKVGFIVNNQIVKKNQINFAIFAKMGFRGLDSGQNRVQA